MTDKRQQPPSYALLLHDGGEKNWLARRHGKWSMLASYEDPKSDNAFIVSPDAMPDLLALARKEYPLATITAVSIADLDKAPTTLVGAASPCGRELLFELCTSGELMATEGGFRTRVLIVGRDGGGMVTVLPANEWTRGRVLVALRTLVLMAMPKALIVSQEFAPTSSFESWVIANGDAAAIRQFYSWEPVFHVGKTEAVGGLENAPLLVRHLAPTTKEHKTTDLSEFGCMFTHVLDMFGVDGEWPPTLYGGFDIIDAMGVGRLIDKTRPE